MASNLLKLRKAAGYKNSNEFAVEYEIPTSTYARYESNPDKIPMDRAGSSRTSSAPPSTPSSTARRPTPRACAARCSSSTTGSRPMRGSSPTSSASSCS